MGTDLGGPDAGDMGGAPDGPPSCEPGDPYRATFSTGQMSTCAIAQDGEVYCMGWYLGSGALVQIDAIALPAPAVQLSSQDFHTCALLADGQLACWGVNAYGELGDGTMSSTNEPVLAIVAQGPDAIEQVAAGTGTTCVLRQSGQVQCWGYNEFGQLGDGTTLNSLTPVTVGVPAARQIAASRTTTCAVTRDQGEAYCWGQNMYGELGDPSFTDPQSGSARRVALTQRVVHVSMGTHHGCAVTEEGDVYCWGKNDYAQVRTPPSSGLAPERTPVKVTLPTRAVMVAANGDHTCAWAVDDQVYCWGRNESGQVNPTQPTVQGQGVTQVPLPLPAAGVSAGYFHSCAGLNDGQLWCWGRGTHGAFGRDVGDDPGPHLIELEQTLLPACIPSDEPPGCEPADEAWTRALSAGALYTCATRRDGQASCWGQNVSGQLAGSPGLPSLTPIVVGGLPQVTHVQSGQLHTCATTEDGQVWCWGNNEFGQLGDGTTQSREAPVLVQGLSDVKELALGQRHTCALTRAHKVRCWGLNNFGQLGDGTVGDGTVTPSAVATLEAETVVSISASINTTCAVLEQGRVKCWGENTYGQLGNNTLTSSALPVNVGEGLTNATQVSCGPRHTCVTRQDGEVSCWGHNSEGQLGDQTTTHRLTPVRVKDLTDVVQVAAGFSSTCARRADKTVWCWGGNGMGQLGDGTGSSSLSPVQVVGLAQVRAISSGFDHACALSSDSSVKCWGSHEVGQLGAGTESVALAPVTPIVTGAGPATSCPVEPEPTCEPPTRQGLFALSTLHSCAVDQGRVFCWGNNDNGAVSGPRPNTVGGNVALSVEPRRVELPQEASAAYVSSYSPPSQVVTQNHSCAVLVDGSAWCWGPNRFGQLGDGTNTERRTPVAVTGLPGQVRAMSLGLNFSCAVLTDGALWCWGDNTSGQLGDGTTQSRVTPGPVMGLPGPVEDVLSLRGSTCALLQDGSVWCWGLNEAGQLGDGTTQSRVTPGPVMGLTGPAKALSGGAAGSTAVVCATLEGGSAACWGRDYGSSWLNSPTPTALQGLPGGLRSLKASALHSCALLTDGELWCWGDNQWGQLGQGHREAVTGFVQPQVLPPTGQAILEIATEGGMDTCAHVEDGSVYCWGLMTRRYLPTVNAPDFVYAVRAPVDLVASPCLAPPTPGVVATCSERRWDITGSAGCAILHDGKLSCWGMTGLKDEPSRLWVPAVVEAVPAPLSYVSLGAGTSCAIRSLGAMGQGDVYCWGEVAPVMRPPGDGTISPSRRPQRVLGLPEGSKAIQVSASEHSCAVLEDGDVWCWGPNDHGELGDGTTQVRVLPVKVQGLPGRALQVLVGRGATCARLEDGQVFCWGQKPLGIDPWPADAPMQYLPTPTPLSLAQPARELITTKRVAGGTGLALLLDGSVVTWNSYLSSGLPSHTTPASNPYYPEASSAVAINDRSACRIDTATRRLLCHGEHTFGMLGPQGNNSSTSFQSAREVTGLGAGTPSELRLGGFLGCALMSDGSDERIMCWGLRGDGQRGDGQVFDPPGGNNFSATPTQVQDPGDLMTQGRRFNPSSIACP